MSTATVIHRRPQETRRSRWTESESANERARKTNDCAIDTSTQHATIADVQEAAGGGRERRHPDDVAATIQPSHMSPFRGHTRDLTDD